MRTFGLRRSEKFELVLQNETTQVVEVRIFLDEREIFPGGLDGKYLVVQGYNHESGRWVLNSGEEITAVGGLSFDGHPITITAHTYVSGALRVTVIAEIRLWDELLETLREKWRRNKVLGDLRVRWQLFPRLERRKDWREDKKGDTL